MATATATLWRRLDFLGLFGRIAFSTLVDFDDVFRFTRFGARSLHNTDHIYSLHHFTKNDVLFHIKD